MCYICFVINRTREGRKRINISVSPTTHERVRKLCKRLGFKSPASMCSKMLTLLVDPDKRRQIKDVHQETGVDVSGENIYDEIATMFSDYSEWERNELPMYVGRIRKSP